MPQWVKCKRRDLPIGVIGYGEFDHDGTPTDGVPRYLKAENFVIGTFCHRVENDPFLFIIISSSLAAPEAGLCVRATHIDDGSWYDEFCVYDLETRP